MLQLRKKCLRLPSALIGFWLQNYRLYSDKKNKKASVSADLTFKKMPCKCFKICNSIES